MPQTKPAHMSSITTVLATLNPVSSRVFANACRPGDTPPIELLIQGSSASHSARMPMEVFVRRLPITGPPEP